ncbi:YwqI/YxiC family protein [Bacillus inaquosorum]|uniref:YwqI/YxiC family protein n=1 Tax=Bacillus inaquosorum TaxID=483913 RepID=UPI002280C196|nr:YwqI/YxiC family protein [Bacillus inaquosorum]MCY7951725.1 YwqI/YxiC family protein [Bacillus inaquosorum]MCY7961607.1 YwqI/YxiC family protein [Bacillus inaquosorum]MEC0520699.1 YwqI/YxiC family protein [Bacillus inaquosorum]MEC0608234.1 YwqI/YxiC family protein [Bacillus inaquosorum]
MAQEIKMVYGTVKQGLSQLKNSAELKSSLPGHISGRNHLNVVKSIEQLNEDIKELTEAYTSVLAKHIAQTESAVNAMKETDENISSSMK